MYYGNSDILFNFKIDNGKTDTTISVYDTPMHIRYLQVKRVV